MLKIVAKAENQVEKWNKLFPKNIILAMTFSSRN